MATKFTYKMRLGGKWDVGSGTRPTQKKKKKKFKSSFFAGLVQRRWTPWSKPKHGFDNYHNKDNSYHHYEQNNFQIIRQQLNRLLNALQTYFKTMLPLNLNPQLNATSALRANDSTLENITDTYSKI